MVLHGAILELPIDPFKDTWSTTRSDGYPMVQVDRAICEVINANQQFSSLFFLASLH
jgi:hypothetical protein